MKNFHYHVLKTNNHLVSVTDSVCEILAAAAEKAVFLTEEVEVDVVVRHSPQNAIPELGICGQYTNDARCIDIYIDLSNDYFKKNFEAELSRVLIHEYMHAVREQYIPWENGTLLESLVAEGLTQNFEIEVRPDLQPAVYATAFTESELKELWNKAKNILNQKGWANDDWFFGNESIKRWSGYSLGFKLVQDKMNETGLSASDLYKINAVDFLPNKK